MLVSQKHDNNTTTTATTQHQRVNKPTHSTQPSTGCPALGQQKKLPFDDPSVNERSCGVIPACFVLSVSRAWPRGHPVHPVPLLSLSEPRLSVLLQLAQLRGRDRSFTLLHALVEQIMLHQPGLLLFIHQLAEFETVPGGTSESRF